MEGECKQVEEVSNDELVVISTCGRSGSRSRSFPEVNFGNMIPTPKDAATKLESRWHGRNELSHVQRIMLSGCQYRS